METETNCPDSPSPTQPSDHDLLLAELDSLRHSHHTLLSKSAAMEEDLNRLQTQKDETLARNAELTRAAGELSGQRDALKEELKRLEAASREKEEESAMKVDEEVKKKERVEDEVRVCKERIEKLETERNEIDEFLIRCADSLRPVKKDIIGIIEGLHDEESRVQYIETEIEAESELGGELREVWDEIMEIKRLVEAAEAKVEGYKEVRHKERRQLGNSVVSLTEENRDISTLLRIALVEKEAVEKRLKGSSETKRVAILQRVGFSSFGFLMGSGGTEVLEGSGGAAKLEGSGGAAKLEGMGSGASNKSDSSECEEEVVSLVSVLHSLAALML